MIQDNFENPYILLTPGPLTTSPSVRYAMRYDSCTWDDDYKSRVTFIRKKLLTLAHCSEKTYTTVLMQGSGTFGVESVLGSAIHREKHCLLILTNGVYGDRMVKMANILQLPHLVYQVAENSPFAKETVEDFLLKNPMITHLAVVHCETTTGILNDLSPIAALVHQYNKYFIVDAMSSFGGIDFNMEQLHIDFLISSSNKCIQGVPGFSFVICKKELMPLCKENAKSLSLDLYDQWIEMENQPGKWRYTSPTHAILAFQQALIELEEEGGVTARGERYKTNQMQLVQGMQSLGFTSYIAPHLQSCIITTFIAPKHVPQSNVPFIFTEFYQYLKTKGYIIYPGKVANQDSFRIGTIGHLFPKDIKKFLAHVSYFIARFSALPMAIDLHNGEKSEEKIKTFSATEIKPYTQTIAHISNIVYKEYPYFYDVEEGAQFYINKYGHFPEAKLCLAFQGNTVIGYAIGVPLKDYHITFQQPFLDRGVDIHRFYYLGELALLKEHRGKGVGKKMLVQMENLIRVENKYPEMCLLHIDENNIVADKSVSRPPFSSFWLKCNYIQKLEFAIHLNWKNVGAANLSSHRLIYWTKQLF